MSTFTLDQQYILHTDTHEASNDITEHQLKRSSKAIVEEIELSDSETPKSVPSNSLVLSDTDPLGNFSTSESDFEDQPTTKPSKQDSSWLIASPYTSQDHLLDLTSLPTQSALLAQALIHLSQATPNYATTDYSEALDWAVVFQHLKGLSVAHNHRWAKAEFYVVEFRSKLKAQIDNALLFKLDEESHREATASGGLLKYWFGTPDEQRRNLATCLWHSKSDAAAGGTGPWHKKARTCIPQMYESINVSGLRLTIEDDVSAWKFEPWV